MKAKPWRWLRDARASMTAQPAEWILIDGSRRIRANVWSNGVWHTWDTHGVGGENGECSGAGAVNDARDQVMAAVVRQGWVSWKVEYPE